MVLVFLLGSVTLFQLEKSYWQVVMEEEPLVVGPNQETTPVILNTIKVFLLSHHDQNTFSTDDLPWLHQN